MHLNSLVAPYGLFADCTGPISLVCTLILLTIQVVLTNDFTGCNPDYTTAGCTLLIIAGCSHFSAPVLVVQIPISDNISCTLCTVTGCTYLFHWLYLIHPAGCTAPISLVAPLHCASCTRASLVAPCWLYLAPISLVVLTYCRPVAL